MRFKELDALRGFACLFVVLFHYNSLLRQSEIFKFGLTGLDLFFMISGFVILMTLNKTKTLYDFVASRFSRLYPTYWVCVSITTLFLLNVPVGKYLVNMTMFQFYFKVPDIDGPYWTMIIEMLFYIYMGVIFSLRQLKNIEIISAAFLLVAFIYSTQYFHDHVSWLWRLFSYKAPLINHFPLFFAGMLFYQMKTDRKTSFRWMLLICCFIVQMMLFDDGGKAKSFITLLDYAPLIAAYFIIFTLFTFNKIGFIANKVTVFMGSISFPLYLIHQAIGVITINRMVSLGLPFFIAMPLTILALIGVAYLIHISIEKPSLKYIRGALKSRNKRASVETPAAPKLTV